MAGAAAKGEGGGLESDEICPRLGEGMTIPYWIEAGHAGLASHAFEVAHELWGDRGV
jgi:hypothetical protein